MNNHPSSTEARIDRVLNALRDAEPPTSLEARITARIANAAEVRPDTPSRSTAIPSTSRAAVILNTSYLAVILNAAKVPGGRSLPAGVGVRDLRILFAKAKLYTLATTTLALLLTLSLLALHLYHKPHAIAQSQPLPNQPYARTQSATLPRASSLSNTPAPQASSPGNTWAPQASSLSNTPILQASGLGNTRAPQASSLSNTPVLQASSPGNTRAPQASSPGNTRAPQASSPGNTRAPQAFSPGNTRVPQGFSLGSHTASERAGVLTPALSQQPTDPDTIALAETLAPSHPAPPMPLTQQERLMLNILHSGDQQEIAALNPIERDVLLAQDAAAFQNFFAPPTPTLNTGDKK